MTKSTRKQIFLISSFNGNSHRQPSFAVCHTQSAEVPESCKPHLNTHVTVGECSIHQLLLCKDFLFPAVPVGLSRLQKILKHFQQITQRNVQTFYFNSVHYEDNTLIHHQGFKQQGSLRCPLSHANCIWILQTFSIASWILYPNTNVVASNI